MFRRRFLFGVLAFAAVAYAAVLAGAYLHQSLEMMNSLPEMARTGTPIADMGVGIGAVLAGLGVLIASVRYLIIPRISEVWQQKSQ